MDVLVRLKQSPDLNSVDNIWAEHKKAIGFAKINPIIGKNSKKFGAMFLLKPADNFYHLD